MVKLQHKPKRDLNLPKIMDVSDFLSVIKEHKDRWVFKFFKGKELHEITYGELYEKIFTLSAGFSALGLENKRVAVIGETSVEWVASYLAILASGGVAIPMDKELALSEINGFLDMVDADAIVHSATFDEGFLPYAEEKKERLFIRKSNKPCDLPNVLSFESVLEKGKANEGYKFPAVKGQSELAEMLFTSGTTGTSKCVMLSQQNIFSVVVSAMETVPFSHDDTIVSVLPVHHTYELACLLAGMAYGMHICINDSLRRVVKNFELFKPTGLVLVPLFVNTMHKKIWAEVEKQGKTKLLKGLINFSEGLRKVGIDLRPKLFSSVLKAFGGRLEKIVCGGAKLNPEMVECFEAFGVSIYEGFGITECSPLAAVNPYYARKLGSIGISVPCCRMRIDPNGDTTDEGYALGEIQVKGYNVMLGYYNNPEATADVFTEDGWFRTGDIGYCDADEYYYITGRSKFVIVLENGKNVFPEEIENYLEGVEGVGESVVLGRKAEGSDEIILTAIVYPDEAVYPKNTETEKIQDEISKRVADLNRTLPSFKQIKKVEIRREEFEKTTSKKIKRHLVK